MLALALSNPDFALDDDEAKRLAKAFVKMQNHYGFEASAKATDTFAFFMVCASIYGPRALPLIRKVTEKKPAPRAKVATGEPAGLSVVA